MRFVNDNNPLEDDDQYSAAPPSRQAKERLFVVVRALAVVCLLFHWFKNLERTHEGLVNTHHRTSIIELSTVIGR